MPGVLGKPTQGMLDNTTVIETPESIDLELETAGVLVRALAYLIDTGIRYFLLAIIGIIFASLGLAGAGLMLICFFVLEWFYPVLFEVLRHGQTPGKKAMGIRVVHDDGTPISWGASMLRNLLRAADWFPFFYFLGVTSMYINPQFKRLGDFAAGTLVTYVPPKWNTPVLPDIEASPLILPGLKPKEQQAILRFAERHQELHPERSEELARLISPYIINGNGSATENVYRVAKGLGADQ